MRRFHDWRRLWGAGVFLACAGAFCVGGEIRDVSSEYQRQVWGREEGLPDLWVNAILQTRDGYLWAATRGGLVRYDGESFKVFDRANTPAFTTDQLTALAEDKDGSLWIGTANGLLHLQEGRFTRFDLKELPMFRQVTCLTPGLHQAVWVGTHNGGVWINRESGRAEPFVGEIATNHLTALQVDAEGTLWAGTIIGLFRLNERTGAMLGTLERPSKDANTVKRLALDPNGVLWGLFDEGDESTFNFSIFRRERSGEWTRRVDGHFPGGYWDVTTFLQMDRQKNWWFSTQNRQIIRFGDRQTASVALPGSDPDDLTISGCLDREGSLWFGTQFTGLGRLRPRPIQNISTESGLPNAPARVVCPARDGSLWIGTDAGVSRYANGACVNYSRSDGLSRNDVKALAEDASGTIWVGTGNGLNSIKGGRITRHRFHRLTPDPDLLEHDPNDAKFNKVRAILAARDGSLWVGTERGLHRLAHGQDQFFTTNQLSNRDVRGLMEDRAGDIWIATDGGGVNRWHDGKFTVLTVANGLSSNHVWGMIEDREGAVWIAAEGGLNRWRDGRFTVFTTRQGLLENQINQILGDDLGGLWLGGDHGLYLAPLSEFEEVAAGRTNAMHPLHYAERDGMLSSLTSGGQGQLAGCKTPDGRLWFPASRGVAVIDPRAAASSRPPPPPVVIQQVVAENRIIYGDDASAPPGADSALHSLRENSPLNPLRIAPGSGRVLEIHFSANTYVDPSRVRYKYRMEGYAENWTEAGARRVAYFTGLPPGPYRFHVIAGDHNNIWNDAGAALDLYLAPFVYQTWRFRIAAVTLLAAVIIVIFRWRGRELRKIHALQSAVSISRERDRIADDLHDGVGAGLTQLQLLAALAERDLPRKEEAESHLRRIASVAEGVSRDLRDFIWLAKWRDETVASLVARVCSQAEQLFRGHDVERAFQIEKLPETPLGPATGRHLYLCAKEAVNNVARHARARNLTITAVCHDSLFELVIRDDGCGFAPDGLNPQDPRGNGLRTMRQRIESIGGRFSVESVPGQGTKITMTIPLEV